MKWLKRLWTWLTSSDPWENPLPGQFVFRERNSADGEFLPGRLLAVAESGEEAAFLARQFPRYTLATLIEGQCEIATERDAWRLLGIYAFREPTISLEEAGVKILERRAA